MPIKYEIFYIDLCQAGMLTAKDAIEQMNELITNKMKEGWNPVGGVAWVIDENTGYYILSQAMTLI